MMIIYTVERILLSVRILSVRWSGAGRSPNFNENNVAVFSLFPGRCGLEPQHLVFLVGGLFLFPGGNRMALLYQRMRETVKRLEHRENLAYLGCKKRDFGFHSARSAPSLSKQNLAKGRAISGTQKNRSYTLSFLSWSADVQSGVAPTKARLGSCIYLR